MPLGELLGWCVVASVGAQPDRTTGALPDPENGTRHFSAGTRVWVLPPQWGDGGEAVFVLGRHRGRPGGLVRLVMPRRLLTGFTVKPVYSPSVMSQLTRPWHPDGRPSTRTWSSRDQAEQAARRWDALDAREAL